MADDNAFDMQGAYDAMRPHQRGLFNLLGAAAQGAKGVYDSGSNAFNTMGRILGYGPPVTMDEVAAGARDAAGFALPGQVGLRRDPRRAMDEATAARLERMPGPSAVPYETFPNDWFGMSSVRRVSPTPPASTANGNVPGGSPLERYNAARNHQQTRADARQYYQDMGEMPTSRARDLEERLRLLNERERSMFSQTKLPENHPTFLSMDAERRALADALENSFLRPVK